MTKTEQVKFLEDAYRRNRETIRKIWLTAYTKCEDHDNQDELVTFMMLSIAEAMHAEGKLDDFLKLAKHYHAMIRRAKQ